MTRMLRVSVVVVALGALSGCGFPGNLAGIGGPQPGLVQFSAGYPRWDESTLSVLYQVEAHYGAYAEAVDLEVELTTSDGLTG